MQTKATRLQRVRADKGKRRTRGDLVSVLAIEDQTQGRFELVEIVVRSGEEPRLHTHTREDEFVYVLDSEDTKQLERSSMNEEIHDA